MFDRITPMPAAGTSNTPPATSRRALGRHLGLSAAGLALAGCSASEPAADPAPAEAGEIRIVGAIYDVSTGVVRFI